jgi:poly-gamma-glutamate capsule biosynthesis protein CapA/YwtB (metallophosphatase superfamily)
MHLFRKIMVLVFVWTFLSSFLLLSPNAQTVSIIENANNDDEIVSLVFSGDIMGHMPQINAAFVKSKNVYDYNPCFEHVKAYYKNADFAVANLEVTLAGPPFSGYPNFSSPDALLTGLKNAGYNVIITANNHTMDRSKRGLERTLNKIIEQDLHFAGSYFNKAQRDSIYPLMLQAKGLQIAMLNCTYGTNGIPVIAPNLVNMIDTVEIKRDIATAKARGADFIVMTIHWGDEYQLAANSKQKELAAFFVRNDVGLVIGSHPHVVQNVDFMTNSNNDTVPVFYSLGNSISNQRKPHTDGGIMANVRINSKTKKIVSTQYLPVYVHKGILNAKYQYHLIPTIDFIADSDKFKIAKADSAQLMFFHNETVKRLANVQIMETNQSLITLKGEFNQR